MNKHELGEWLVYEKAIVLADIDKYVKKYMNNAIRTPFTETKYVNDLKDVVAKFVCVEVVNHFRYESIDELLVLLEEPEIKEIINKHFLREYLYD